MKRETDLDRSIQDGIDRIQRRLENVDELIQEVVNEVIALRRGRTFTPLRWISFRNTPK